MASHLCCQLVRRYHEGSSPSPPAPVLHRTAVLRPFPAGKDPPSATAATAPTVATTLPAARCVWAGRGCRVGREAGGGGGGGGGGGPLRAGHYQGLREGAAAAVLTAADRASAARVATPRYTTYVVWWTRAGGGGGCATCGIPRGTTPRGEWGTPLLVRRPPRALRPLRLAKPAGATAMGSPGRDEDQSPAARRRHRGSSSPGEDKGRVGGGGHGAAGRVAAAAAALEAAAVATTAAPDDPVGRPAAGLLGTGEEGRRCASAVGAAGAPPGLGPPDGVKAPPPARAEVLPPSARDVACAPPLAEANNGGVAPVKVPRRRGSLGLDANGKSAPGEHLPAPVATDVGVPSETKAAAAGPGTGTKTASGPVAGTKAAAGPDTTTKPVIGLSRHDRRPPSVVCSPAADGSLTAAASSALEADSCPPGDAPSPTAAAAAAALFDRPHSSATRRRPTDAAGAVLPADEVVAAPTVSSAPLSPSGGAGDIVARGGGAGEKVKKKKSPPKYLLNFPESAEAALRGMDDDGIRRVQARQSRALYALAMILTTLTAVETALAVPGMLFALGYDSAASWLTASLVCLGILSQLPKKLIWRRRPWMSGRAVGLRRDSTSSFPSRAVVCAVVFPIVSLRAYAAEAAYRTAASPYVTSGSGILAAGRQAELAASTAAVAAAASAAGARARGWGPSALLWRLSPSGGSSALHALSSVSLVSSFVLLTAWSRVHVGAHYPSDTGAGALFGALISSVGSWAHDLWGRSGCATATGACYYAPHAVNLTSETVWSRLPYRGLAVAIAVSYGVTLASFKGFWVKCSYVYGLLFSCVTLRWVLLCPVGGTPAAPAVALPPLPVQTMSAHMTVVAVFGALLAFGMATRGLHGAFRLINFTVTYFGSLVFIIAWRLRHAAPEMGGPALGAVAEALLRQGTAV
ncbi:hypothetical protein MMPV_006535 [Pyropia vietnamensis]